MYLRRLKDVSKKTSLLRCFWEVFEMSLSMEICLRHLKDISCRLGALLPITKVISYHLVNHINLWSSIELMNYHSCKWLNKTLSFALRGYFRCRCERSFMCPCPHLLENVVMSLCVIISVFGSFLSNRYISRYTSCIIFNTN